MSVEISSLITGWRTGAKTRVPVSGLTLHPATSAATSPEPPHRVLPKQFQTYQRKRSLVRSPLLLSGFCSHPAAQRAPICPFFTTPNVTLQSLEPSFSTSSPRHCGRRLCGSLQGQEDGCGVSRRIQILQGEREKRYFSQ